MALLALVGLVGCGRVVAPPAPATPPAAAPRSVPEGPAPGPASDAATPAETAPLPDADPTLAVAMRDAALYLSKACLADGRFAYRVHLDPERDQGLSYNVLRHAGAIYALADYQRRWPAPQVGAAIERATTRLWTFARPVGDDPQVVAIWSAKRDDVAKLGGAGLALVALATVNDVELAPPDRVETLLRFVDWMQRDDGSFYSKYFADKGRDDSWTSLYYPGEAALGVALAGGPRWHRIAVGALRHLATTRAGKKNVPPDHWALIATGAVLERVDLDVEARAQLLGHARQVVDRMLDAPERHDRSSPKHGSWGATGRTTPTATRLEGLIAALGYLTEEDDAERRPRLEQRVRAGIDFLLRTRITEGELKGAMPRAAGWKQAADPRAGEVRIDYVQHALSAFIAWHDFTRPKG